MITYMGLDFETTGLDALENVPLTLGLAWQGEDQIESKHFEFNLRSRNKWNSEAMYVNKLEPKFQFMDNTPDHYDWSICQFLMEQGYSPFDKTIVPVGWNVGGFDMRFMQTFFPQASKFFSHRYLELNSLVYACRLRGYDNIKQDCKEYAEEQSGDSGPSWHDAQWDAIASLHAKNHMDHILSINLEV